MRSLIKFELKKIVTRRVSQVSFAVILLMVLTALSFNVTSQYALDPDEFNTELVGTTAIAQIKKNADALAGPITNEKTTETFREYKTFINSEGEIKNEYRADRPSAGSKAAEYWRFDATHNAYLSLLTRPWMAGYQMPVSVVSNINTTHTVDLYSQIHVKQQSQLNAAEGTFIYSDAEKDFWTNKANEVAAPIEYGYKGGWKDFLDLAQTLIFALLAVVITCAAVFNVEYQEKTDAVILSTKYGKTRLGSAKVFAAIIVASAIYWIFALVLLFVPIVFFGADGAALPIQSFKLVIPYSLNMIGAAVESCLIGYAAMLGILGIVLALSARMRSSMGILAVGVALIFIPMFAPNISNDIMNHVLYLFPYFSLDPNNLLDMVSYAIGPLVIEYPIMLSIFYLVLFAVGSLLAIHSFNKHQVA